MASVRLGPALAALLVVVSGCVSDERSTRSTGTSDDALAAAANNTTLLGPPPIDVALRHDFTRGDLTRTVEIPPNATLQVYSVYFAVMPNPGGMAGACATLTAKITIRDPAGETYDEVSAAATQTGVSTGADGRGVCGTERTVINETGLPFAPAGNWTFEFTGRGVAWGVVVMNSDLTRAPQL